MTKMKSPRFITVRTDGDCGGKGCANKPVTDRICTMDSTPQPDSIRSQIEEAVEDFRDEKGEEHPDFIFALGTIAEACAKNGDDDEALRYYEECIPLLKKLKGKGHPKVADTMVSMALSMSKLDMSEEAISNLEAALSMYTKTVNHKKNRAQTYDIWFRIMNATNQVGNAYFQQNRMEEAGDKYREALQISKKFASDEITDDSCLSLHVSDIINNIACVKAEQKQYEDSILLFNQTLELQIAGLGEVDPAVSITLNNIGTMNFRARKYEVALKAYKQVLKMRRYIFNADHYSICDVLIDIALCYRKKKDYDRGTRALKEALRIARKTYGDNHKKVHDIYEALGTIAERSGNIERSEYYFGAANNLDDDIFVGNRSFETVSLSL